MQAVAILHLLQAASKLALSHVLGFTGLPTAFCPAFFMVLLSLGAMVDQRLATDLSGPEHQRPRASMLRALEDTTTLEHTTGCSRI